MMVPMNNEDNKKVTPPYLSVRKIVELVDLVSSRNITEAITADFFKSRNFGTADSILAINTLRFLNLLNDDGAPTPGMEKMRIKGDERKPEFEKIVRSGYRKLFDSVDPLQLTSDKLMTEFIAVYKISDRVAKSAIPAFNKLLEYSGLKEEKTTPKRSASVGIPKPSASSQVKKINQPAFKGATSVRVGFSAVPVADGRFEVYMMEDLKNKLLDNEKLGEVWGKVRSAIRELDEAYKQETKVEGGEVIEQNKNI